MADEHTLHLYPSSRHGDPSALQPGRDLVLDLPYGHGMTVPDGVLIDDHLSCAQRHAIDHEAEAALRAWHRAYDAPLGGQPASVGDLWDAELYAEVFLPTLRVARGVAAAVDAYAPERLVTHGLDPELVAALADDLSVTAVSVQEAGAAVRYPSEDAVPRGNVTTPPLWLRLVRGLINATGIPSLPRGTIVVVPYGPTTPVLTRLTEGGRLSPVLYGPFPPPPREALRTASRGGWIGLPGVRRQRRARAQLRAGLARARALAPPELTGRPATDALLCRRALRCLAARALPSLAFADLVEAQFRRHRFRAVVVPFDNEPRVKALVRSAQSHGVPVLAIQHGYEPQKRFHPGEVSDLLGQWSHWDLDALPPERRTRARVVGNPARGRVAPTPRRGTQRPHAVVLTEHVSRMSATLDRRIAARHLLTALQALTGSTREWRVTVRPHPSDNLAEFRAIVDQAATKGIVVDAATPILDLLSSADVCVGALSTASLQTALTGTALVMLMPDPIACLPPLDGSGQVLHARTAEELTERLETALAAGGPVAGDELLTALGHGPPEPLEAILDWISELAASAG